MAIARPISKTIISTTAWGIPITDQVNANAADIAAMKPTAWTNLTFQNGWAASGGSVCQYRKVGDMVQLRGLIGGGPTGVSTIATLPVGFRPYRENYITTLTYTGTSWLPSAIRLSSTDGIMEWHLLNPNPANGYISIAYQFSTIA